MKYEEVAKINVNDKTEKKGTLTYLSWAWAVDQLQRMDNEANWTYGEPKLYGETMMVFCTVTAFGRARTAQLPVMDYKNRAIPSPDAMQVNTAMQRCLAKAIALHGLGLYIYAGEDVPAEGAAEPKAEKPLPLSAKSVTQDEWDNLDADTQKWLQGITDSVRAELESKGAEAALLILEEQGLEAHHKTALWSRLDSKERSAIKAAGRKV